MVIRRLCGPHSARISLSRSEPFVRCCYALNVKADPRCVYEVVDPAVALQWSGCGGSNLSDSGNHRALLLVLGVAAISLMLGSAAEVASSANAANSTAEGALAIAEETASRIETLESNSSGDLEDRIATLESQTSDLESQDREQSARIDDVESEVRTQALMRSW